MTVLTVFASSYITGGLGGDWTNPTNVYADDTTYATRAGTAKNTWYGTLFGFDLSALPDDAIINSVTLEAQWHNSTADTAGPEFKLGAKSGGSEVGTGTTDTTGQTGDELVTYSPTGLTAANLKATGANGFLAILNFRRTDNTAHTASCDYVKVTIDYSPAPKELWASKGTFTLTGSNAEIRGQFKTFAQSGGFTLTGSNATLQLAKMLLAQSGTYNLTGWDAILTYGQSLNKFLLAGTGGFSLSGQDAMLIRVGKLLAESGAFILTGADGQLRALRAIRSSAGTFSLAGQNATLSRLAKLLAIGGGFTIDGKSAQLRGQFKTLAGTGDFVLTGYNAILEKTVIGQYLLQCAAGIFNLQGKESDLAAVRKLFSQPGIFTLQGDDSLGLAGRQLLANAGSYDLTGYDAILTWTQLQQYLLQGGTGAYTLLGKNAILAIGTLVYVYGNAFSAIRILQTAQANTGAKMTVTSSTKTRMTAEGGDKIGS